MNHARDLVSEPANVLTPKAFAERCVELGELGLEVELLDRDAMAALGMNALLGVAQGSAEPPFIAIMRWNGGGTETPLALVGKGVCFDTGGISIKPAQGMEEMKADMGGAAAVFGAMRPWPAARPAPTSSAWSGWSRTCPRLRRSGRATWSVACPARRSR